MSAEEGLEPEHLTRRRRPTPSRDRVAGHPSRSEPSCFGSVLLDPPCCSRFSLLRGRSTRLARAPVLGRPRAATREKLGSGAVH